MMYKVLAAALLVASASANYPMSAPANHPEIIKMVNTDPASSWVAGENSKFNGATLKDVKTLLGVDMSKSVKLQAEVLNLTNVEIPASFDARDQWKNCPLIGKARDQSACGSCWAFGSTEAFNDRMCIASQGSFQTELSAQDTASCCSGLSCGFSQGCNGGQPTAAWQWFTRRGVVSGAGYDTIGSGSSCWPYQLEICAHHVTDPKIPSCPENEYSTPACRSSCSESKYGTPFAQDIHKAKKAYSINGENQIMAQIVQNGPVTAAFTVYADFPTYKSGVYVPHSSQELGGHAIKIVGYGTENGLPYWTVMNSWNQDWGMDGAFKIKRGVCGIDDDVSAGDV